MSSFLRLTNVWKLTGPAFRQISGFSVPQPSRFYASSAARSRKKQRFQKTVPAHSPLELLQKTDSSKEPVLEDDFATLSQPERISKKEQLRFHPKPRESDAPVVELTEDEKYIGIPMLKKVVTSLEAQGSSFILPWNDDSAIEKILNIMNEITSTTGLKVEFLVDAFIQKPSLFSAMTNHGDKTIEILDTLSDICGFTIQDSLRMFASYTKELLECTSEEVIQRLSVFTGVGIQAGYQIGRIARKCPAILFGGNAAQMNQTVSNIGEFFSNTQVKKVLQKNPEITLMNFEEVESKYEYIYFVMGIESDEFIYCSNWPTMPLDEIMDRHEFLVKTGKYSLPDPKRPQLKMENPPLYRILDTREDNFAIQVAEVTVEEWRMYRELSAKLRALENKDRPFERIKPSMRKAYQRKFKDAKEQLDFVFE